MNAKQAEELSGISRRNLRFYEQRGLIHPARNPENEYRDYSEEDLKNLKLIRALRMLDTPLEEIDACLKNEITIGALFTAQAERLQSKKQEVEMSLSICRKLQTVEKNEKINIDQLLLQMDAPDMQGKLSDSWKNDYMQVAAAEAKKSFSFTPDDPVKTPAEFTAVLQKYAKENSLDFLMLKEGLEPEFEINGIAYRAQRIYRAMGPVPTMVVSCTALHPELLETDVKGFKKKLMKFLHNWWWLSLLLLMVLPLVQIAETPGEALAILLAGTALPAFLLATQYWVFKNHQN